MDTEKSLAYLDQLPNRRVRRSVDSPPKEDSNAGLIDSQLITFTSNLESKFKEAVKYSTQIAEHLASQQHDHNADRFNWYEAYCQTLRHCGWIGSTNKLTEYHNSSLEVTMEDVAIELVKLAAGPNAAVIAELTGAAINALKSDGNMLAKLQASSMSGKSGTFDILPCLQKGDDVVMYNHTMAFTTAKDSGGFWFWSWKMSEVSLQHCANEWSLNYSHYQTVEDKIKSKLGGASNDFFDAMLP